MNFIWKSIFPFVLVLFLFLEISWSSNGDLCVRYVKGTTDEELQGPRVDFVDKNLNRARQFFLNLDNQNPHLEECVTVRLEISVGWNRAAHFDQNKVNFNNSLTCPPHQSSFYPDLNWGLEIWFLDPAHRHPETNKRLAYMDTATLPTVIYHEYAHVAMQPYFPSLFRYHPLPEAYANYFAAAIFGKPVIAGEGKGTSKANRLRFSTMESYRPFLDEVEASPHAPDKSYPKNVPSLFWWSRHSVGGPMMDKIVWTSLKYLTEKSKQIDVVEALRSAAIELSSQIPREKMESLAYNWKYWKDGKSHGWKDDLDKKWDANFAHYWPKRASK